MENMGTLEAAVLPLATFWVIVSTIQSAATFVNNMREQVVTGGSERCSFTLAHRRALFLDWKLSMLGTIASAFGFAGLIVVVAQQLSKMPGATAVVSIFYAVAAFPALGGLLFIVCAVSDIKLMNRALREAAAEAI